MSNPKNNPTPGSAHPKAPERPNSGRKRILVVEGDGFTRLVLMVMFRMAGLAVGFASNATLALIKLRAYPHDAILVDLKLRGMSGLELIQTVRREPFFGNRPIYVFAHINSLKRATEKEVRAIATKVFDKRSLSVESVVQSITAELTHVPVEALPKQKPAATPAPGTPKDVVLPVEIHEIIDGVRAQLDQLSRHSESDARVESCGELLSRVRSVAFCARAAGARNLARQAKALEDLLNQLSTMPQKLADTALGTIARAVEVLGWLACGPAGKEQPLPQFDAVIIDESPASNKALSGALLEAGLNPLSFENPGQALTHLKSHATDLVVANLSVPELHGLDLASLRQLPLHGATPVIYAPPSSIQDHFRESRPPSARLVEPDSLLVKELVMQALNEVQGKDAPHSAPSATRARGQLKPGAGMLPDGDSEPGSSDQASRTAQHKTPTRHGKKTILFVEDDPFALKVYRKALKRAGFRIEVAEDGQEALNLLPGLKPDLVVLDLMLPKVDGVEVLKFIRADSNLGATPVIILSNAYLDGLPTRAMEAGANLVLSKTECTPVRLVEQVRELLAHAGETPSLESLQAQEELVPASDDPDLAAETTIWARQAGLRKVAPKEVARIRQASLSYIKAGDPEKGLAHLTDLYRQVRFFTAHASLIGFTKLAAVSSALEGLLFEIVFKQSQPTSAIFQTIAQAVDLLDRLVQTDDTAFVEPRTTPKVLVVEDDAVCNFTSVVALKRANFEVVGVQDPDEGLRLLQTTQFDLVVLDINTPGRDGFEVCEELRRLPQYKSTPVLFVTMQSDFRARARSVIAGANDLIAKPVSPLHLILKVTLHLLTPAGQTVSLADGPQPAPGDSQAGGDCTNPLSLDDSRRAETLPGSVAQPEPVLPDVPEPAGHRMAASGPPSEVFPSPETGAALPESEAETFTTLSARAPAESPADESHAGAWQPQPSVSAPERYGQEPASETRKADTEFLVAAAAPQAPSSPPSDFVAGATERQATAEVVGLAAPPLGQEETAGQPQEPQSISAEQPTAAEKYQTEREALVNRIVTAENELYRSEVRLKRKEALIEDLQKQLEELSALRARVEQQADLERAKGELEQRAKEHERAESELRAQLDAAEAAHCQTKSRVAELERELTALQQASEELNGRFVKEQQASAETGQRVKELEQHLSERVAEWERAQSSWEQQAKAREQAEADLRAQLDAIGAAAKERETLHEQMQARCAVLEGEVNGLRQAREELRTRCAREERVSADAGKQAKELEERLSQRAAELERAQEALEKQAKERGRAEADLRKHLDERAAELERARAEAERQAKAHEQAESDLRRQLEAATVTAKQSEAAHSQVQSRVAQVERELAEAQRASQELNARVAREQASGTETGKRAAELEQHLSQLTAELERARAEAERQAKAREQAESDLRRQLEAATVTAKQSEAAHSQVQSRVAQVERELAEAQRASQELNARVAREQASGTETGKRVAELEQHLSQRAEELQRARAEAERQAKAHEQAESDLRRQLEAASAAAKQSETAHSQAQSRVAQVERELAEAQRASQELNTRVAKQQAAGTETGKRVKELEQHLNQREAELQRARAELEDQADARSAAESNLRAQLEAATASAKQSEAAHQQTQARCGRFEQELTALRQARQELKASFVGEQRASAELRKRLHDLENCVSRRSVELERAKADHEKHAQGHAQAESDLRRKLEAASAAAKQSDEAHREAQARCSQMEEELANLRQARQQFETSFVNEQRVVGEMRNRLQDLEAHLSRRAAEQESARAQMEKQTQEHGQVEAGLRAQLDAADVARDQAQSQVSHLRQELAVLQQAHQELNCRFAKEQALTADTGKGFKELERQLSERAAELDHARTELANQAKARGAAESTLRAQLDETSTKHRQAQTRIEQLVQEMAALRQTGEQLNSNVAQAQQASAKADQRIKELERSLDAKSADLARARAELEDQTKTHGAAESNLRAQLDAAGTKHSQAESRIAKLVQEVAALRQTGAQLNSNVAQAQQASAKADQRIKELERSLDAKSADLARARAELEDQAKTHGAAESNLRAQLDATGTKQSQAEARIAKLVQEMAALRQTGEQLNSSVAQAQQASAKADQRIKELERSLDAKSADLARARAELEDQAKTHGAAESNLRAQLDAAGTKHSQAESKIAELVQEMAALRQTGEQLNSNVAQAQQASAKADQRIKELERSLDAKSADLARARVELEDQAKARGTAESNFRAQLEAAGTKHSQAESRIAELVQEMAALRQTGEELSCRFAQEQHVSAQCGQRVKELESHLGATSAELDRVRTEVVNQARAHGRAESDLRAQLDTASTAHNQARSRVAAVEQELAGLQQACEKLTGQVAKEQQAAAAARAQIRELEQQARADEDKRQAQTAELEHRISQGVAALTRVTADLANERGARQRSDERAAALEARLKELHEELSRMLQAQRAGQERIGQLEAEVRQQTATLAQRAAALEQQTAERCLAEEQLQKSRELNARFRQDIRFYEAASQAFARTRQELEAQVEAGLNSLRDSNTRLQLEAAERQQLAAALDDARHQLEDQNRKRDTLEAELQASLQGLQVSEAKLRQEVAERQRLATALEGTQHELQDQCRKRDTLAAELQATVRGLQEAEAKLQQEAAERQRLATLLDGTQRDLQTQSQRGEALEAELQATRRGLETTETSLRQEAAEHRRLAAELDGAQRALQVQAQKQETLEVELQAARQDLEANASRLHQETAAHQRLDESLQAAEFKLRDQFQRVELERSQNQSALHLEQIERKRQETQIIRMRHLTLEAARGARALRNTLRRQVREPMEALHQSACNLLQLELSGEQKRLAETILSDVLLAHARLQEPVALPDPPIKSGPGPENNANAGNGNGH